MWVLSSTLASMAVLYQYGRMIFTEVVNSVGSQTTFDSIIPIYNIS